MRLVAALLTAVVVFPTYAHAESIPRSHDALPVAAEVRRQLDLEAVTPDELLAGGLAQFNFFFPAGAGTELSGRPQLDALMSATVLLEEGLRRGGGSWEHARALFEGYVLMYGAGRSGLAGGIEAVLPASGGGQMVELYRETLGALEEHGRASAYSLGELLMLLRPERTEIAYFLAELASEEGDTEAAAEYMRRGVDAEAYANHLLRLSELQGLAGDGGAEERERALALDPTLDEASAQELVEPRQRLEELRSQGEDDLDEGQRYELAQLYLELGRPHRALRLFDGLEEWRGAPDGFVIEHAVAAMEASNPTRMSEVLGPTRDDASPSSRLLQLRLVAASVDVFRASVGGERSLPLDELIADEAHASLRDDLERLEASDPTAAQFVRAYLGLMVAMGELRRVGEMSEAVGEALRDDIDELIELTPDDHSARRFTLLHALYAQDADTLASALDSYRAYCAGHDCADEADRAAVLFTLQLVSTRADTDLIGTIESTLERLSETSPVFGKLAQGSAALAQATLGRRPDDDRERLLSEAAEVLREAAAYVPDSQAASTDVRGADYLAIFNALGFIALEHRDVGGARLFLDAARRYQAMHPVLLLNLGVALASGRNYNDAFITFGLGASESMSDPALAFQCLRWAGHIYSLAGRPIESAGAWEQALTLFEDGREWTATVDDGVFPGWPVDWGIVFDQESGLAVGFELGTPPLFYSPAPVSVLEMSAASGG